MADFDWNSILASSLKPPQAQSAALPDGTPMLLANNGALAGGPPPQTVAMNQPMPRPRPPPVLPTVDDTEPSSPAPPPLAAAPESDDPSKYRVTPEDLQQAHDNKHAALMMGAVGNALANQQSWGNFFTGKMNQKQDVMGDAQKFAELADDNIKNKQVLMKQAQAETPNTLQRMQAAQQLNQLKEYQDPNSGPSKLSKSIALGAISQIEMPAEQRSQLTAAIQSGNAMQINSLVDSNPLLKEQFSATIAGKKMAQTMVMMQARLAQGDRRLEIREDDQASHAGQAVETAVKPFKNTLNSIDRAESLLNGKEPVTAKSLAIAQQDFINSVAQGGAATEGKVNREMIHTIDEAINDAKLRFGNIADLRKSQPQIIEHMRGLFAQVKADYRQAMQQQMQDTSGSYSQTSNKKVQETLKGKADRYQAPGSESPAGGSSKMDPGDVEAFNWAKQNRGTEDAQRILLKISKKYPGAQ